MAVGEFSINAKFTSYTYLHRIDYMIVTTSLMLILK